VRAVHLGFNPTPATGPAVTASVLKIGRKESLFQFRNVVGQDIADGFLQPVDAQPRVALTVDVEKIFPGITGCDAFCRCDCFRKPGQITWRHHKVPVFLPQIQEVLTDIRGYPVILFPPARAVQVDKIGDPEFFATTGSEARSRRGCRPSQLRLYAHADVHGSGLPEDISVP